MRNYKEIRLSDHFDYSTLLRFTVPSILMMVITSIYSIIDGLFISNFVGSDGFAAVNLMMPLAMMISCVGFMAGAGGNVLISKTLGEGREEQARKYFSLIVYIVLGFSVAVGFPVFLFIPKIAVFMGAGGAVYANCVIYGRILIAALPAFILQILFENFLVVAERPKMGMVIAVSSGITNIILDALFVVVFKWGIGGAAAATVVGQVIGGIVPFIYFLLKKNRLLWFVKTSFDINALKKVSANGFFNFINNASLAFIGIIFNLRLMFLIGSDGVVAYGVVMYVNYIVSGVFIGYATGVSPIFSYNLGTKNTAEIKGLFKRSIVLTTVAAVCLTALIMIFAKPLAAIFVSYGEKLMSLTTTAIRLYAFSFLVCGFNIFAAAFFAAMNQGKLASILSLTRLLVFQIAAVFILPLILGNNGIWLSVVFAELLAVSVALFFMIKNRKKRAH